MSRLDSGNRITVKPSPNVYSALAAVGAIASILALAYAFFGGWKVLISP